jgi:hypothetical protein
MVIDIHLLEMLQYTPLVNAELLLDIGDVTGTNGRGFEVFVSV